jgi:formamidopyrimidine-DNA glycosylase
MLLFRTSNGLALAMHLKIAGQLVLEVADHPRLVGGHPYPRPDADFPDSSTRFLLSFSGDLRLWFNDQRRFGWLRLMPAADLDDFVAGHAYGPDPIADGFTVDVFRRRLDARAGRPVKVALLDQTCIAGVGNIYADESLYRARIHPRRLAGSLNPAEVHALHRELVHILQVAVPVGGALMRGNRKVEVVDDVDAGRDFLEAHGCAGAPCARCVARGDADREHAPLITRTVVGGRGTYLCAICQPEPSGLA